MKNLICFIVLAIILAAAWVFTGGVVDRKYHYWQKSRTLIPHLSEFEDPKKLPALVIDKNRFVSPRQKRAVTGD